MSILQADGLEFSDGSVLESLYGIIPQDKRMVFYQAAAPTGWTKLTQVSAPGDLDGSAIRVTSGAGGSVVGTTDFTTSMPATPKAFASVQPAIAAGSVGPHTLVEEEIPTHNHEIGSREVDDGPPSPTAYQATVQRSYAERLPFTNQRAYQQPSVYRQPIIYQQPDAYQVNQSRRSYANQQRTDTYQQLNNPITQNPYQRPGRQDRRFQTVENRGNPNPNFPQPRTTPVVVQVQTPVPQPRQISAPRREPISIRRRQVRNQQRNVNRRNSQRRRAAVRPSSRPDRHRQRRSRRRPYYQQNRRHRYPTSLRYTESRRQNRRIFYQVSRGFQYPASNARTQGQGPANVQQNREVRIYVRVNRAERVRGSDRVPQSRNIPVNRPNPFPLPVPFRSPSAYQQPSETRVTVNAGRPTDKRINANTNVPVRVTQVYQQSNVNFSPYPQPLIVPGDQIRGDTTNGPATALVGGGNAHTHPFTGDNFSPQITAPSGFSLRVQYIDVIVCSFD